MAARGFYLYEHVFGFPDGIVPRLRCRIFGHDWYQCGDECCDGRWWCYRCTAPRPEEKR